MIHSLTKSIRRPSARIAYGTLWRDRRLQKPSNRVNDMDYQIAFAATVATASFLVFMLVVHRT
ncbi:hypothetical protein JOH51_003199 [Rhizobium leguminosarum]|nr:hypothetical protein [Rhizobium leguminosarum]